MPYFLECVFYSVNVKTLKVEVDDLVSPRQTRQAARCVGIPVWRLLSVGRFWLEVGHQSPDDHMTAHNASDKPCIASGFSITTATTSSTVPSWWLFYHRILLPPQTIHFSISMSLTPSRMPTKICTRLTVAASSSCQTRVKHALVTSSNRYGTD